MKKTVTNNLGLKILALFFAILLWFIVLNIEDPITTKSFSQIPVTVTHPEIVTNQGKTYQVSDDTKVVTVQVKAKSSVLKRIKSEDIKATADMAEMQNRTSIPIEVTIPSFIGKYSEAKSTPRNIQVSIDANKTKTFPIVPVTSGTLRSGYAIGTCVANPEKVEISGPETVINSIEKVVAEVNVSGLSRDAELEATMGLYDANGKIIDATRVETNLGEDGVKVNITILQSKSIPVNVDSSAIDPADGYVISEVSVQPEKVEIIGTRQQLDSISQIEIPAEALKIDGISENEEVTVDLKEYLPQWAKVPDETVGAQVVVSIVVTRSGTKKYSIPVASIPLVNVPKDLLAEFPNGGNISIVVGGSDEELDAFTLEEGSVSINLINYNEEGTYSVPIQVNLPAGLQLEEPVSVDIQLVKNGGDDNGQ